MTLSLDYLRKKMGWCPQKSLNPVRKESACPGMNLHAPPAGGACVNEEVIVDYGSTGTSPLFFIVFFAGVTGIVLLLTIVRIVYPDMAGIFLCGFILITAMIMLYQDIRHAILEYMPETLVIHRPPLKPVVIPKDTVASAEIRDNTRPVPLWLLKVLLLVIPASSAGAVYGRYSQLASGGITSQSFLLFLGFGICIVLFFLAIYYHSFLRSHYPKTLVITTIKGKIAVLYGEDPERLAEIQKILV